MKRFQHAMKRQRGSVLVLLAAGLVTLLGATGLSVDIGYFFAFKNELQNAVDAAAIAGAQGLLAEPGNVSASGRAKQYAIAYAAQNMAGNQPVTLSPSEVSFPNGNTIRINMVRPANTFFGRVLGISAINVRVNAAAVVTPVTGGGGMRPWAILDQFGHGAWCVPPNDASINSPPHGPFNPDPHTWRGVTAVDHYKSPYDPEFDGLDISNEGDCSNVTGLLAARDLTGQQMQLKCFGCTGGGGGKGKSGGGNPWLTPGNFGAIALGGTGASNYRSNIAYGYPGIVRLGDILETEPGNMVGPTLQGVIELIAQDPSASTRRDSSGHWVVTSGLYPLNESPRIVPIPMYSVYYSPANGRSEFRVDAIASFFIEGSDGRDVWGRFIQSRARNGEAGRPPQNGGSRSVGAGGRLLATIRLIEMEE